MLKIDQILLRQVSILFIIVMRLKLIEHFFELPTVLLQLLAPDLPHLVRLLEVFDFFAQGRQLLVFFVGTFLARIILLLGLLLSPLPLSFDGKRMWVGRYPLHVILLVPLDQVDAFKHVGDVIYAALLHLQLLHCLIQIELLVRL